MISEHFQDNPQLSGLPAPPLLYLCVWREDVLVRVGHTRHLPGRQVHRGQHDDGDLHRQCPPAHGGAGLSPIPAA